MLVWGYAMLLADCRVVSFSVSPRALSCVISWSVSVENTALVALQLIYNLDHVVFCELFLSFVLHEWGCLHSMIVGQPLSMCLFFVQVCQRS